MRIRQLYSKSNRPLLFIIWTRGADLYNEGNDREHSREPVRSGWAFNYLGNKTDFKLELIYE